MLFVTHDPTNVRDCITRASSISLRTPRTSLLSYLFSSSTSTCGVEVIFRFWYIDMCSEKTLLPGQLTRNTTNMASLLLGLQGLGEGVISLSPFESLLLSLKAL
jgi:hypothetical protein